MKRFYKRRPSVSAVRASLGAHRPGGSITGPALTRGASVCDHEADALGWMEDGEGDGWIAKRLDPLPDPVPAPVQTLLDAGYTFRLTSAGELHLCGRPFNPKQAAWFERHRDMVEAYARRRLTPMRRDAEQARRDAGLIPKQLTPETANSAGRK